MKRYTNTDLAQLIIENQATLTALTEQVGILTGRTNTLTEQVGTLTGQVETVAGQIKTLATHYVEFHGEFKQEIRRLDQKIDAVETRLTDEIGNKTDDVISVMKEFINLSSDKYSNHEKRIVTLERAAVG